MAEVVLDTAALRTDTHAVNEVDYSAEVRVMAALFADASLLDELSEKVSPEDFGFFGHELACAAMLACDSSGRPVDLVTVADEMARAGNLTSIGGMDGLRVMAAAAATTAEEAVTNVAAAVTDFGAYLDIVAERSTRRRLMAAARKISAEVISSGADAAGLVENAEQAVFAVSKSRSSTSLQTMPQVVAEVHDRMAKVRTSKLVGHSWGFHTLDEVTAGLQAGQMITIAGRPGTGKSTLATQVANQVAQATDTTAVVLSYEMQASDIGMRLLAASSGVPLSDLMLGRVPDSMDDIVAREAEKMAATRLLIDDNPPPTIAGVRSMLRRLSRRVELGVVVIDYLQLMSGSGSRRDGNRENEVAEMSRGVKMLASDLKIPAIVCSQLNRGLEQRPNKRPMLSDLRESGSIEQDSNVVVFVYRHSLYDPQAPESEAELIVAKNRNGPAPVTAYVDWEGRCTRFRDSDRQGPTEGGLVPPAPRAGMPAGGGYSGPVDPFGY